MGFLANIIDTGKSEVSRPEGTSVVCEFLDVFLADMPGLPPAREIEFAIESVPEAAPVSKARNLSQA